MFVPLGDSNPLKVIPFQYVTVGLILANIVCFALELASGPSESLINDLAVVPAELFQAGLLASGPSVHFSGITIPENVTLISYMFLHADFMHLFGNMLFLWVFGDNVEDALGHFRFLVFYLLCGVAAALAHALMMPDSGEPMIGAGPYPVSSVLIWCSIRAFASGFWR